MALRYRQRTPEIQEGKTRVWDVATQRAGTVRLKLAVQILVDYDDGTEGFLMNGSYGYDWEIEDGST
jgi:hypothetical protein